MELSNVVVVEDAGPRRPKAAARRGWLHPVSWFRQPSSPLVARIGALNVEERRPPSAGRSGRTHSSVSTRASARTIVGDDDDVATSESALDVRRWESARAARERCAANVRAQQS